MDPQVTVPILLFFAGVFMGVLGWIARMGLQEVKNLAESVKNLAITVSALQATVAAVQNEQKAIWNRIDKIEVNK